MAPAGEIRRALFLPALLSASGARIAKKQNGSYHFGVIRAAAVRGRAMSQDHKRIRPMRPPANSLEYQWMPFSANKHFKAEPRLFTEGKGMYLKNHRGETVMD